MNHVFRRYLSFPVLILLALILLTPSLSLESAIEDLGVSRVFYIYPEKSKGATMVFISFSSDNIVEIYSLDDGNIRLEANITLQALTPYKYTPVGSYLKIISKEPIMVYVRTSEYGGEGGTYYPSINGRFVDKKFIVFPFADIESHNTTIEIYAVEDGIVEVKNETFRVTIPVLAGTFSSLNLTVSEVDNSYFNITSTGKIMVAGALGFPWITAPSASGRLVGKIHYGHTHLMNPNYGSFSVIAFEPGLVKIINLTEPSKIIQHEFKKPGELWFQSYFDNTPVKIEGNVDTYVQLGSAEYSPSAAYFGQNYAGGRITEDDKIEYWFYVNGRWRGVIFAPEDVTFDLNGTELSLKADEYRVLVAGLYHVISPKPLVIQTQPLVGYAVAPSGIPVTKPEITAQEGMPLTQTIVIVVAVIIIIVTAVTIVIKKKK